MVVGWRNRGSVVGGAMDHYPLGGVEYLQSLGEEGC